MSSNMAKTILKKNREKRPRETPKNYTQELILDMRRRRRRRDTEGAADLQAEYKQTASARCTGTLHEGGRDGR